MFEKIKTKLNNKSDVQHLINLLIQKIKDKQSISEDPLLDGFIIGLIYCNSKYITTLLLTEDVLPPLTDNNIQQLEQVLIWITNNQNLLFDLLNNGN
jgi:hypothetical protein